MTMTGDDLDRLLDAPDAAGLAVAQRIAGFVRSLRDNGFAIGLAEALVSAIGLSVWKDGVVFAILIIVLLVKPTGLLGRPMREKV